MTTAVLAAGLLQATPLAAQAAPVDRHEPAVVSNETPAPARTPLPVRPKTVNNAAKLAAKAPAVPWPSAATAQVAPSGRASVGGLKVLVKSGAGARIETMARETSDRAGVAGPVLRVSPSAGPVTVTVDYTTFAGAHGGDFGARLRLVRLPACALTTPESPKCAPVPIDAAVNDAEHGTLTAAVPAQSLVALDAAESSAQGSYGATSLAPSSKWNVAPSSGAYNWDYPVTVPPVPSGQVPTISLGYNSQAIDGRTSTTNNQGSWIGEGFGYEPGYVERQYNSCTDDGHDTSPDLCWAYDNATISLNGKSSTLVRTGSTWRFASDDGSKIERATDTVNGDNDNEYWKVTTTDGTQYFFGLNRLPGYAAATTKTETNSAWTVPVYGDDATNAEDDAKEPCYNATFGSAWCQQAWRWNLDYVKDLHGNVTSYWYTKENNAYAQAGKTDVNGTAYARGGYLARIEYGQRDGTVYSTPAPARVLFGTAERCLPSGTVTCKPEELTEATALNWQDTPTDRICAEGTKCKASQASPSFFTRRRLTGITTQIRTATDWAPVDGYALEHIFTNNGDGSRSLWLSTITHSGYGGVVGATASTLPSVRLEPLQLPNRIDIPDDNVLPLIRPRLSTVYTEAGAQIDVDYADPDCSADSLPSPGRSTRRCYPVKWTPGGEKDPITDWFHKYVVRQVIETDRTGGEPDQVTRYDYLGDAAWRYADATGLSKDENDYRSWSQWRGYKQVSVTEGSDQLQTTKSVHTYLRGLDGDKDPDGGTRSVTRTDSTGTDYTDTDELAGFEIETDVYDGDQVIAKSLTGPWLHQTASVKHAWGTDKANYLMPATSRGASRLADGSWRETKSVTSYDDTWGRATQVQDSGDTSTAADNQCTRTTYADNATTNVHNLIARKETVAVDCSATPDRATQVLADERTYYDKLALGAAPGKGDATSGEKLASHDGTTATYVSTGTSTFDDFGRPLIVADGAGTQTKIAYTQTNGLTTRKVETGPLGDVTTDYAPAWMVPLGQTDLNGKRTDLVYDKFGRLTQVLLPNRPAATTAATKYTYNFAEGQPVSVKTEKLRNDGTYRAEFQIYDGFLRPRQLQAEGQAGERLIADTLYTPTGQLKQTNDTYAATGAPSGEIYPAVNGDTYGQTRYLYDGADRVTDVITLVSGQEKWRTTTTYEGADRVSVTPPVGGTTTTTLSDARGQNTALLQYHGRAASGAADTTRYTYTPAGQLSTVTDPAGNTWEHYYDQRGRETRTVDPDAGTSTSKYDDLDRLTDATDARGHTITTDYDTMGRKKALREGTTTLASWTWDTVAKGELYAADRFVGANKYEIRNTRLDALYRPLQTQYVIPAGDVGTALGGTYSFSSTYNIDGTQQGVAYPEKGGLPAEGVVYTYDALQQITKVTGASVYADDFKYDHTGSLLSTNIKAGGRQAWATSTYEKGTNRLTDTGVTRENIVTPGGPADPTPASDVKQHYTYDDAGNVLSITDKPDSGERDLQCFQYDYLRRMTEAWTSASTADDPCAGGASATGVGGVAPYRESYTYDLVGNRKTAHVISGSSDVTRSYTYPDAGRTRPHGVTSMTETSAAGSKLYEYGYDDSGDTELRSEAGEDQNLTWDAEGNLATVAKAGKTTSYIYSADGSRLVRKEPGVTTVYLPGEELRLNTTTQGIEGTRFYPIGNQATVVRNASSVQFQFADPHGTGAVAVDAATGAITKRRTDPFGNLRGAQPAAGAWVGEKGFVGGNQDTSTGLTQLGARLYDPVNGKFISVDPVIDVGDPQQMNAYSYANNSPVTYTDPAGTRPILGESLADDQKYMRDNGLAWHTDGTGRWTMVKTGHAPSPRNTTTASTPSEPAQAAAARGRAEKAKQILIEAAKALGKIAMDELGITDALDCVTKGALGACFETVLNIAGSFVGGIAAKIARKYGAPWKWKKAYELGQKLWDLGGKIVDGIRTWMKESKAAKALAKTCLHSFAAGTLILMANGSLKPIDRIVVGDVVEAVDPATGRHVDHKVEATHVNHDRDLADVVTVDADGQVATVYTTQRHLFWDVSARAWVNAAELTVGDLLASDRGAGVRVASVTSYDGQAVMHDLTVDDVHTYYVLAGGTPVLVHNRDDISMDEALDRAAEHVGDNPRTVRSGSGGVQFMNDSVDESGNKVTKIARFDINPASNHVQKLGPHLNLETQINNSTVRTGPLADPHLGIDASTIRPGDYC